MGKCRLTFVAPPLSTSTSTVPVQSGRECGGGGGVGRLWLFCGENQLIWNAQRWDLGGLDLNGPRPAAQARLNCLIDWLRLGGIFSAGPPERRSMSERAPRQKRTASRPFAIQLLPRPWSWWCRQRRRVEVVRAIVLQSPETNLLLSY